MNRTLKYLINRREFLDFQIEECQKKIKEFESNGMECDIAYKAKKESLKYYQSEWTEVDMCIKELKES